MVIDLVYEKHLHVMLYSILNTSTVAVLNGTTFHPFLVWRWRWPRFEASSSTKARSLQQEKDGTVNCFCVQIQASLAL